MNTFLNTLNQRNLGALFQPIADFSRGTFIGVEGLIRGPVGSPLHNPVNLFAAARQHGFALETEMLSRQIVLASFAKQNQPGNLFLNISSDTLLHPRFKRFQPRAYLEYLGIEPQRVVIEISAAPSTADSGIMRNAILHYRSMGFRIALDELAGDSTSERICADVHPEFIKVSRQFIQDVDSDPRKQQIVRSIQNFARREAQVIAQGIETAAEFEFVRDCGIACGQGYFIGCPAPAPMLTTSTKVTIPFERVRPAPHSNSRRDGIGAREMWHYHAETGTPTALPKQMPAY